MRSTPEAGQLAVAPTAPSTCEVAVAGGSIEIETRGEGVPVVLLHGWALDRRVWRPQLESLSDRFRLIAVDRRGFGRSSAPPGLALEAEDLLRIQDRLGLGLFLLVGMSQAGRVALRFALDHPDRLLGLVLQGAPLDGFLPEPRGEDLIPLGDYSALVRAGQPERMKQLWGAHSLMRACSGSKALLAGLLDDYEARDLVEPGPSDMPDMAGRLGSIPVPALAVTGSEDTPWRRLVADALAYGLPRARRATVQGAPHLCNLTHPAAFGALLVDFAREVGR